MKMIEALRAAENLALESQLRGKECDATKLPPEILYHVVADHLGVERIAFQPTHVLRIIERLKDSLSPGQRSDSVDSMREHFAERGLNWIKPMHIGPEVYRSRSPFLEKLTLLALISHLRGFDEAEHAEMMFHFEDCISNEAKRLGGTTHAQQAGPDE